MKNHLPIILIAILSALSISCKKEGCPPGLADFNKGEIVSDAPAFERCGLAEVKDLIVIRTKEEFASVFYAGNCAPPFPSIDFEEHTLIGAYAGTGACFAAFERDVRRADAEKKVMFTIVLKHCGSCEKLIGSENLVLVPKIPADWSVELSVKKVEVGD